MSSNTAIPVPPPSKAPALVKWIVSLVLLFHFTAIISHVLSGGGPFVMRQLSTLFRPYLKTMWLDNAYRFYAPDPGPTDVLWFHLNYADGSTRWTQVPRREDFYFRMPFQRHMSIALLASMMVEQEPVPARDNNESLARILASNTPIMRTVLTPVGEIFYRSYARHIARTDKQHPRTHAELASMDCYLVKYNIRSPFEMRMKLDMYDPRMLRILQVATFTPDGLICNHEEGFKEKAADDLFIELIQNEITPLLEANAALPAGQRQPIMSILKDYGIPFPFIQPLVTLSEEEKVQFFKKPLDRDTLRERYARVVKRNDVSLQRIIDMALTANSMVPVKFDLAKALLVDKTTKKATDTKTKSDTGNKKD